MADFLSILFDPDNGGFELGAFSPGWVANEAVITTEEANFGDYSSELEAVGASINGARSDSINVDETEEYRIDAFLKTLDGGNLLTNPGFEDGDFTGWTQNNSTIETDRALSGLYSSKIVAIGSTINGARQPIDVDETRNYQIDSWHNITARAAGAYLLIIQCKDAVSGGGATLATFTVFTGSAVTLGFEQGDKTIGPIGSGMDFEFPVGTLSIILRHQWGSGATGTAYMDDVDFHLLIAGSYQLRLLCYDDVNGNGVVTSLTVDSKAIITSGWEKTQKTVGPSGGGSDLTFPAGTSSVEFRQQWGSNSAGRGYLDDVSLSISELEIAPLESFPSGRRINKLQSRRLTGGGKADVEDLGIELEYVRLILNKLSEVDKISLENLIRNTVNWSTEYFHFTDDQGNDFYNCLFWFDDWNPVQGNQKTVQRYDEEILLIVGA